MAPGELTTTIDPVLASVFGKRLKAIGDQMGHALMRTARSVMLVAMGDFSLGIYDRDGRLIEQTEYIPVLGYATAPAMKQIVAYFGDDLAPGDVILHNDVFSGGNQLLDVKVAKPVFVDGELVAWTVINAHQLDIGGSVIGGYNPNAREVWQEGLRITPLKIIDAGKRRQDLWDMIFSNVREAAVADDIEAAIGGCTLGERGIVELVERYGLEAFRVYSDNLLDVAERLARAEIASWPDGVYRGSASATYAGVGDFDQLDIAITATVAGDRLTLDFEGTSAQAPDYMNAPLATTLSAVLIGIYMCMDRAVPHNEGILRAIDIRVPEGSFLNPRFPAATAYGNMFSEQIVPALMMALSPVVPDRVTATWAPTLGGGALLPDPERGGIHNLRPLNPTKGGGGGTAGVDGFPGIGSICAAGSWGNLDPEMWELMDPILVREYEWLADSAGAGEWRGGHGIICEFELGLGVVTLRCMGDGVAEEFAPAGVLGGLPGSLNRIELEEPDGSRIPVLPHTLIERALPAGVVWRQRSGGGGGFGDPRARRRDLVAADVRAGLVSERVAREVYGFDGPALDAALAARARDDRLAADG